MASPASLIPLIGLGIGAALLASSSSSAVKGGASGGGGGVQPSQPLVVEPGGIVYPTNVGEWIVLNTGGIKFQDVSVWDAATAAFADAKTYQITNDPKTGDLLFTSNLPLTVTRFVVYAQVEGTSAKLAWTVDYSDVNEDDIPDLNMGNGSSNSIFGRTNAKSNAKSSNTPYYTVGSKTRTTAGKATTAQRVNAGRRRR